MLVIYDSRNDPGCNGNKYDSDSKARSKKMKVMVKYWYSPKLYPRSIVKV